MLRAIRNIAYVILLCEDVARMRAFYRDVMQFPLEEDEGYWVKFRVGSGFLTLRPRGRHYDGPGVQGGASVQLAFRVAPSVVELCHKELLRLRAEILGFSPSLRPSAKARHTRPKCAFAYCVHFADRKPCVGSA